MGRLEKIVVVTVLFLVAVILGVSLNSSSPEEAAGKGPVTNREGKLGPRTRHNEGAQTPADANAPGNAAPNGLLNANVTPATNPASAPATNAPSNVPAQPLQSGAQPNAQAAASSAPANAPINAPATSVAKTTPPAAAFLVSREGLEPTASEDWMLYSWKAGDTFKDLAQRYYGSPLHVARLRAANEGRDETKLAAGDKILVSVKSATALDSAAQIPQSKDAADKKSTWAGGMYEVKSGDVLSTISTQVYGTSKKWKKIYDANRDVIGSDPNKLVLGMKLRIPE